MQEKEVLEAVAAPAAILGEVCCLLSERLRKGGQEDGSVGKVLENLSVTLRLQTEASCGGAWAGDGD